MWTLKIELLITLTESVLSLGARWQGGGSCLTSVTRCEIQGKVSQCASTPVSPSCKWGDSHT